MILGIGGKISQLGNGVAASEAVHVFGIAFQPEDGGTVHQLAVELTQIRLHRGILLREGIPVSHGEFHVALGAVAVPEEITLSLVGTYVHAEVFKRLVGYLVIRVGGKNGYLRKQDGKCQHCRKDQRKLSHVLSPLYQSLTRGGDVIL